MLNLPNSHLTPENWLESPILTLDEYIEQDKLDKKSLMTFTVTWGWKPSGILNELKKYIPNLTYEVAKEEFDTKQKTWYIKVVENNELRFEIKVYEWLPEKYVEYLNPNTIQKARMMILHYDTKDDDTSGFFLVSTKDLFGW